MSEKLILMKLLLNKDVEETSEDDILTHFLNKSLGNILGYCNISLLTVEYDPVVVDYAVYLYKNKDSVGLTDKHEGERSAKYESGIPASIRLSLPLPRIKVGY